MTVYDKHTLISVIIPVYNVERYVKECVDTVLAQTHKEIEVLLVDDGSTDASGAICDSLQRSDSRISVFHKANGGLSDARNYGLRKANGEVISFIDSDDVVSPFFLETLLSAMRQSGAVAAAVSDGATFHDDDSFQAKLDFDETSAFESLRIISEQAYQEGLLYQQFATGAPFHLLPRERLGNDPFPVGLYYEDLATTYRLMHGVGTVALIETNRLYGYRLRKSGIISQPYMRIKSDSSIVVSSRMYDEITNWYPALESAASSRCFSVNRLVFSQIPSAFIEDTNAVWAELKKHRRKVLFDRKARLRERIAAFAACCGKKPFRVFCSVAKRLALIR